MAFFLASIGLVLIIYFSFFSKAFNDGSGELNPVLANNYGGLIGGLVGPLFSLAGFILLYVTIVSQRQSFEEQQKSSFIQQFETRFFELIRLHRNNVNELESKGKKGRKVLIEIKDEFQGLFTEIKSRYPLESTSKPESAWKKDCIKIAYFITYFGINNSSTEYLKERIYKILGANSEGSDLRIGIYIDSLITVHKQRKLELDKYLPYDGHQSRLGHYYRHLFQTVKYINNQPAHLFDYDKKYEYVKTLRAQLSTHEQALLLYNSVSELGESWELSDKITDQNQKLITKYNLIKNITEGFTEGIKPKDFYADVYFENDEKPTPNRIELEKIYRSKS